MASKIGRRPPKLRASCDGCYHAKVKCKGTPTGCLRCLSQGLNCVYSPSMRNQTHNRNNLVNKKSAQHEDRLHQPSFGRGHRDIVDQTLDNNDNHEDLTQKEQESYISSVFPYDDLDMALWDGSKHEQRQQGQGIPPSSNTGTAASTDLDFCMMPANLDDLHCYFNTTDLASLAIHPQDQLYLNDASTGTISFDQDTLNLDLPSKSNTNSNSSIITDPTSKCQCFNEMIQNIETSRSQSLETAGIDSVMNHNRQAMARVCNLLRCTKEHDTMVGMLVLVLISKILNLCESVYRAQQENDTDGDSPNSAMMGARTASTTSLNGTQVATPASTQPSLSISPSSGFSFSNTQSISGMGNNTPSTRLTLGSYEFDQDDEHQLKTQMILIRLTKLKSLLNRFNEAQWTGGKSMMDISSTMRGILLERVEAVMECMQMSVKF